MRLYQRYASADYEGNKYSPTTDDDCKTPEQCKLVQISPLFGQFSENCDYDMLINEWMKLFERAAFFAGYDQSVLGTEVTLVFENEDTKKINTISITRFAVSYYENLLLDPKSRFWPSCENLSPEYKDSNVRRALAISNLKNYNVVVNHSNKASLHLDETDAGSLANSMELLTTKSPLALGKKLLEMGLLQSHSISSQLIDVIYVNQGSDKNIIESNNKLVYLFGDQIEQLFDPLLEYSPESMDVRYNPPNKVDYVPPQLGFNKEIEAVIDELVHVQTNYTMNLVNLLQNFIVPLRAQVLDSQTTVGIAKLNKIFPPTIDEITRINCILHDALSRATKFGYVEVLKVMGMIIPYFYKAFIRHEANLKHFTQRLNKFYNKNNQRIFQNQKINKGEYSPREIDSIVSGSRLELPKLKLILKRLYETIEEERVKVANFEGAYKDNENINEYYDSAIKVIDAFGGDSQVFDNLETHRRVFTPTGKILTEMASRWPSDLQYGWISRKVVAIYELRNIKPDDGSMFNIDVLIIFSDKVLFLTILEEKYYEEHDGSQSKSLLISDVLMHSLMNEKPLPALSLIPSMQVSCWCDVNDILVSYYHGIEEKSSQVREYLRFLNTSNDGFQGNFTEPLHSKNYEILSGDKIQYNGRRIVESINKAKVLSKKQPFHLFKTTSEEMDIYASAQELSSYLKEGCKSPFGLFLNSSSIEQKNYFEEFPELYLVLHATLIDENNIELKGSNKSQTYLINEVISTTSFQSYIMDIIITNIQHMFTTFNFVTESLFQGYEFDLRYFMVYFANKSLKGIESGDNRRMSSLANQAKEIKTPNAETRKRVYTPFSENIVIDDTLDEAPKSKKRRSFFKKMMDKIKGSKSKKMHSHNTFLNKDISRKNINKETLIKKSLDNVLNKSESVISLSRSSTPFVESTQKDSSELPQSSFVEATETPLKLPIQPHTHNATNSIEVNSHFEFPAKEDKQTDTESYNNRTLNDHNSVVYAAGVKSDASLVDGIRLLDPAKKWDINDFKCHLYSYDTDNYYNDGESNWVLISKEDSKISIHSQIEQNTSEQEKVEPQRPVIADADIKATKYNLRETASETSKYDTSTDSSSSLNLIDSFSKLIDVNFKSSNDLAQRREVGGAYTDNQNAIKSESLRLHNNSSDEEFYSTDDFHERQSNYTKQGSIGNLSSTSSDGTIINDSCIGKVPVSVAMNEIGRSENTRASKEISSSYNSLNFILDIISGKIELSFN
ncbi:uncharacterized protein PRCAT00000841001 [Priceomyces carsonii]|uniref:uncharacterized protein n=1 Tax=Priceomyces carsonii TaxID=28549 RepID=UPI002EDA6A90|nr:unnamed protein product [Priceomyces carsonii]